MEQYEYHNTQVRIARAELESRRSSMSHADYAAALGMIGHEKAAPTIVDRMATGLLGIIAGVVALVVLAVYLLWFAALLAIAPGALVTSLVVNTLDMHPPLWFMYLFGIVLSAVLLHRIYVLRGRVREKAVHTYLWACLVTSWVVLIPMFVGAAWPKDLYGLYNGSRNGVDLVPDALRWHGSWDEAAYEQQRAAQEGNQQPAATSSQVAIVAASKPIPEPSTSAAQPAASAVPVEHPPGGSVATVPASAQPENNATPERQEQKPAAPEATAPRELDEIKASFDCRKARSFHEQHVCANTNLAKLDVELAARYQAAMASAKVPHVVRLDQGKWLRELDVCRDDACLAREYEARIEQLTKVAAGTADR